MSSLIWLVIVTAWAVVLVPMLLSRHEAGNEVRSVDRFASAMRVLARRSAASSEGRYVVMPPRPESSPSVVVNGTTPFTSYVGAAAPPPRRVSAPVPERLIERVTELPEAREERKLHMVRRRVMMRRRRVMLSLVVVALALVGLAVLTSRLWWVAQVVADVALIAYVVHVRRETARMAARRARVAARARRAAEERAAADAVALARARLPVPANAVIIERQEDGSWHPVPVPLPTYVNAAVAPQQPATAPRTSEADQPEAQRTVSTEEDLDRRIDDMERRLAVND